VTADVGQKINLLQELILTTMRHSTLKNFRIEAIRPQWARFAGHVHRAKNMLCALASRGIRTVSEGQNLCRKKYFWDEGTIPYGFGEKSGAGKKSAGDCGKDGAVWLQFGNPKENSPTMRSTEWLPASRLVLGLVPRPARVAPRVAIGDRGRSQKK
jgi:hypothetical protein